MVKLGITWNLFHSPVGLSFFLRKWGRRGDPGTPPPPFSRPPLLFFFFLYAGIRNRKQSSFFPFFLCIQEFKREKNLLASPPFPPFEIFYFSSFPSGSEESTVFFFPSFQERFSPFFFFPPPLRSERKLRSSLSFPLPQAFPPPFPSSSFLVDQRMRKRRGEWNSISHFLFFFSLKALLFLFFFPPSFSFSWGRGVSNPFPPPPLFLSFSSPQNFTLCRRFFDERLDRRSHKGTFFPSFPFFFLLSYGVFFFFTGGRPRPGEREKGQKKFPFPLS